MFHSSQCGYIFTLQILFIAFAASKPASTQWEIQFHNTVSVLQKSSLQARFFSQEAWETSCVRHGHERRRFSVAVLSPQSSRGGDQSHGKERIIVEIDTKYVTVL